MDKTKGLEERVADLEDYVERLAILIGKLSRSVTNRGNNMPMSFNPVENTK